MSAEIDSMEKSDKESYEIIRGFARDGYTVLMDFIKSNPLPGNVRRELHHCRTYSAKSHWPAPVREYSDQLATQFVEVPEEELMAAVYATARSPKWFNSDWIAEVCAWLVMTASQKSNVVIVEANRGAYSWLTHKCLLKIGLIKGKKDINTFQMPKNCYVTPVLSVDGSRSMELANRKGCLFVDTPLKELSNQIATMSLLAQESVTEWLQGSNSIGAADSHWLDGMKELLTTAGDKAGRLMVSREPISPLAQTTQPLSRTDPTPATQTPDKATPSNSVISIHGIRTTAPWQKSLTTALSRASLLHFPHDYGKFGLIRFAREASRQKILKDFIDFYAKNGFGKKNAPSIVAHSFGSYIVCKALSKYVDIHFKNVILLGSIVHPSFNWSQLIMSGRVNAVLNEIAANDVWVRQAVYMVSDAGPSGQSGFTDLADGAVIERKHFEFEHSDALNGLAFETAWLEFIRTGKI